MATNYIDADIEERNGRLYLSPYVEIKDLLYAPLDWQKAGLQQTASGYGKRLTQSYKIQFNGRFYRLYTTCFSNVGSTWFISKGRKIFVG